MQKENKTGIAKYHAYWIDQSLQTPENYESTILERTA